MDEKDIIENGLYNLQTKPGEKYDNWCKHNLLIVSKNTGQWIFTDTYWGLPCQDSIRYKFNDIKDRITFIINLNFAKEVSKEEFEQYEDKDTAYIPIGGGSEKYLIDSRATKSRKKIIVLIAYKIESLRNVIAYMQRELKQKEEMLISVNSGGSIDNLWIN